MKKIVLTSASPKAYGLRVFLYDKSETSKYKKIGISRAVFFKTIFLSEIILIIQRANDVRSNVLKSADLGAGYLSSEPG